MAFGKGIAMWISGFFTFFAGLNTFNAVMLWVYDGADSTIDPYYNILRIGGMHATDYFSWSLIATFSFLGITSLIAYGRVSTHQAIQEMTDEVENGLEDTWKKIDDANIGLAAKLEMDRMEHRQLSDTVNTNISNTRKEVLNAMDRQEKALQGNREDFLSVKKGFQNVREEMLGMVEKRAEAIRKDWLSTTQANLDSIRKEMKKTLEKQGKALQLIERSSKQSVTVMRRQMAELEYLKTELETLSAGFTLPTPRLNSHKGPEEIKGVGPRLGAELRCMGITNVGEFITTDPVVIAEKTPISQDMATRFQARAQLLMIPGIDEIDAELLENVGIQSRKELASQNSIHLSKRIAEVAKAYVKQGKIAKSESPTIEEVSSWIKYANL